MYQTATTKPLALPVLLLLACGPTDIGGDQTAVPNGPGADGGDRNDDLNSDARPKPGCGEQTEEIPLLAGAPDLLIVLDASGSMSQGTGFLGFGKTKWKAMGEALTSITNSHQGSIQFGLTVFPTEGGNGGCQVAAGTSVDIGLQNASAIQEFLDDKGPAGNTPAHQALENARAIFEAKSVNPAGRYVLFATDGEPNCVHNNVPDPLAEAATRTRAAVEALAQDGIDTFVLGFGGRLNRDLMSELAIAGGQPSPLGPPSYYQADDEASLQKALDTIAGGILPPPCSFTLAKEPPDPDNVTVNIDGTAIARDPSHTSGWDYHPDASTISFFGDACSALNGGDKEVQFSFGCAGPIVD